MDKISLLRKGLSSTESHQINKQDIHQVVYVSDRDYEIHTLQHIYIHDLSVETLQHLYINEGFRWIDETQLINMNFVGTLDECHCVDESILPLEGLTQLPASQTNSRKLNSRNSRLKESEQRVYSLFENNPSAICLLDVHGRFVDVNPATEVITGYHTSDFIHKAMDHFIIPEDIALWQRSFAEALQGQRQSFELNFLHQSGKTLTFLVTDVPITYNDKIEGIFAICKDITDEKRAKDLLIKSEKLSIVGQLAAGVAHEIRNPLTSLKGFAQLLKNRVPQFTDFFEIMLVELDRINFIVSELLVVSKPQAVNFQLNHIDDTLANTIELLHPQAILNNVEIIFNPTYTLPLVRYDENQLKQVFINILNNAIDSMPNGGHIHINAYEDDLQQLVISFIDEGVGISKERIPLLGEPFYSTKEKGTGLGLMVSYQIMKNHGGHIHIQSEIDIGTTVQLKLTMNYL
jgi:two-component system, sporulation sensor kinase E